MKKLFLIIGAPGSGKTTDASIVAKANENMEHYSTGDLLRDEVATKSELGLKINGYISKGELVPLDIVIKAIVSAIKNSKSESILLDGYPRSIEQMKKFDEVLSEDDGVCLKGVIEIDVSEKVAKDRVLGRARGADDDEQIFANRMEVFNAPIEEIRDFYKSKNIYHSINGERTIDEIVADINTLLSKIN